MERAVRAHPAIVVAGLGPAGLALGAGLVRLGDAGFAAGTLLDGPAGAVAVERLRAGDTVCGPDGGTVRLRHAGPAPATLAPPMLVLLPADALAPGVPRRPLLVAAGQGIRLSGGHAVAARGLVCGGTVSWAQSPRTSSAPPLYRLLAEPDAPGGGAVLAEGLACTLRRPPRLADEPRLGAALAAARRAQITPPIAHRTAPPADCELEGAVALDAGRRLVGWAIDRGGPGSPVLPSPVLLVVSCGGATLGYALAADARTDLAAAGRGACGFTFTLPACALAAGGQAANGRLLHVRAADRDRALPGTPLLVEADSGR